MEVLSRYTGVYCLVSFIGGIEASIPPSEWETWVKVDGAIPASFPLPT